MTRVAIASASGILRPVGNSSTSLRTDSVRNIRSGCWYRYDTRSASWAAERFRVFTPQTSTVPERGTISPVSNFSRVDLPAPLEPTTATRSPSCRVRSMPSSTGVMLPPTDR